MKLSHLSACVICMGIVLLSSACVPAVGPVFVNISGTTVYTTATYADGHIIKGDLEHGHIFWAGYAGGPISSVVIQIGDSVFRLDAAELRTPLEGDKWAAFILKKKGPVKVHLNEARQALPNR